MPQRNYYIFSNIDFSKKSASATRMGYYAKALSSDVNKVYFLSCSKNKISDEDFIEVETNVFRLKKIQSTTGPISTFKFLKRMNSFASKNIGENIFFLYPYPLVFLEVLSILYLKYYRKNPLYSEFNEIRKYSSSFHAPISLKKIKYSFKKIVFKTTFSLIEPLLCFFDGLVCISSNIEAYAHKFNKNTLRIPILTDPDRAIENPLEKFQTKSTFNIGFSGSIAPSKENLADFINVLDTLIESGYKISFNLCGHIAKSYEKELLQKIKESGYINYFGNLNETELSAFLSSQDLLVIPRGYTKQNNYGFSTKLSDYLNHEKVILVTDISDNALYIKDGNNGFIVPANNNEAMSEKLKYIIENFKTFEKRIVDSAYETSKKMFHYSNFKNELEVFLKK